MVVIYLQRQMTEETRFQVEMFGLQMTYEPMWALQTCQSFLNNQTTYYMQDETYKIDIDYTGTKILQFASLLDEMGQVESQEENN